MFPFTQGQLHDDSSAFGRGSVSFEWFSVVSDDITASATTGFLSVVAEVRNGFALDRLFRSGCTLALLRGGIHLAVLAALLLVMLWLWIRL